MTGLSWERVAMLLLLAPLIEEAVFRAGLQEWLLRRGLAPGRANVSTALAFAGLHALARLQWMAFAVALPALLVGSVYGRWRLLRWCVLLHAAFNGAWLAWRSMSTGA